MKVKHLLLSVLVSAVSSYSFSQTRSGDNVLINQKITRDLYVAGGTVVIDAPIDGDVIAAGGTITINDSVMQDILVAGGNVLLNGYVGDDIRCTGGTITLSDRLAGDFIVAGGRINVDKDAIVGGDMLVTGGQVTVDGKVDGVVKTVSGEFTLNGTVHGLEGRGNAIAINGTVYGPASLAAQTVEIGSQAAFEDNVSYWTENGTVDFKSSLKNGKATFDSSLAIEDTKWHFLGFASLLAVIWYLGAVMVMVILMQYFFGSTFSRAADSVKNMSLKSLGLGFLFLIGVPVAMVLAMVTIIGVPVGILMLVAYITVVLLATAIVSLLMSHWISKSYYGASWTSRKLVLIAFVIFIVLKLASLTPVIGPLIMLLLACMAFGGILMNIKWRRSDRQVLT